MGNDRDPGAARPATIARGADPPRGEGAMMDLAKMFHELRNPFAAIHTAVSLIGEISGSTPLSAVRRQLQLIQDAAERGVDLLEEYERRAGSPPDDRHAPPINQNGA
jgi:hypothetical protein